MSGRVLKALLLYAEEQHMMHDKFACVWGIFKWDAKYYGRTIEEFAELWLNGRKVYFK